MMLGERKKNHMRAIVENKVRMNTHKYFCTYVATNKQNITKIKICQQRVWLLSTKAYEKKSTLSQGQDMFIMMTNFINQDDSFEEGGTEVTSKIKSKKASTQQYACYNN